MKITQEVREYAEKLGLDPAEAIVEGMKEKSEEYVEQGSRLYVPTE